MGTFLRDLPVYQAWTMDKSNFTPLGMVVLWGPFLFLTILVTVAILIITVVFTIVVLPIAGLGWCLGWVDTRLGISSRAPAVVCKLSTGLKLLRRC